MKNKNFILFIISGFIIVGIIGFNFYVKSYFEKNNQILKDFDKLKHLELALNYEILSQNVFLYKNLDTLPKIEENINKVLDKLDKNQNFKKTNSYKIFLEYKKLIHKKIINSYRFETFNTPLKNSNMFIIKLLPNLLDLKLSKKEKVLIIDIADKIFLSKATFDVSLISELKKDFNNLSKIKNKNLYLNNIYYNLRFIINTFPEFNFVLEEVLNSKSETILSKMRQEFLKETNDKLNMFSYISLISIIIIIAISMVILILFIKIEKDNKKLYQITIRDSLTNLFNRRKLNEDISKMKNPLLFLVNIDRFKYFNDIYGVEVGDFILKQTAKTLQEIFPKNLNPIFYRIGADDFGILVENKNIKIQIIANNIIEYFDKHSYSYKNIDMNVSVSIGISDKHPLIETADIILKVIKKSNKIRFGLYDENIGYIKNIKENMKKTKILKSAIENNNIIPFYQPITDNKTGKIVKYEVLARVYDNEKYLSIYPFLNIAKENKLYKYITKAIYLQAFEKFKDRNIHFSLNISIEDLTNEETMKLIESLFDKYPKTLKYLTFEILEDDAIKNYDILKDFIKWVKTKGVTIAIDDFGSGYSNFAHILNLDIDFLKIDGSLIKYIDKDKKMRMIVETIEEFAKKVGMKTIAEFVSSKEILEEVKNLNIDYTQGFYLGEPKKDLVDE